MSFGRSSELDARRILVTGAAGFIGSHLVERLLEEGYAVWALDNFDPAYSPAVKRSNLRDTLRHPRMHLVEGDLRDNVLLDGLFGDRAFDVVMHLAALRGALSPLDDPHLCFQVNLLGTVNLLEAMRRKGVSRIVFTSDRSLSARLDGEEPEDEADPAERPLTSFAAAKRSVELLCHVHHRTYGTSVHVLRLAPVYGPREGPDGPVHRIARQLAGEEDGAPITPPLVNGDYLYVDDAVAGLVSSLERLLQLPSEAPVFEIVTLSGSDVVPAEELEARVAAALGVRSSPAVPSNGDVRPGDGEFGAAAGGERAMELLDFRPGVPLDEGLARFADWYRRRRAAPDALSGSGAR